MKKYVYLFSEGNGSMRELLGGKGANLAEMTGLGLSLIHIFLNSRFSYGIVLEAEELGMVAGLRVLKHHTVPVIGLTADHGQTVAVVHVEVLQVKSVSLFNRHNTLAVDNGDVQVPVSYTHLLAVTLGDCAYRALTCAGTAADASARNYVCHGNSTSNSNYILILS